MFNLRGSLSSCLTVVAFLVLTILAARYYGDTNSKTDFENSSLYQKGQVVVNTVWSYAKVIAGVNIIKNVGVGNANLGENVKSAVVSPEVNSPADSQGNFDALAKWLKKELNLGGDLKATSSASTGAAANSGLNSYDIENNRPLVDLTKQTKTNVPDSNGSNIASNDLKDINLKEEISSISSFINYRKTVEGAEIVITSKSGQEYKLTLPFKFLAQ